MYSSSEGPKSEEDWQAECDARTIAEGEVIKADEKRFERAQAAAKKMAEAAAVEANALKAIADAKMVYKVEPGKEY